MTTRKVLGALRVKIDGREYDCAKGATFDPGGAERTAVTSGVRVVGYSEAPKESEFEGDLIVDASFSATDINRVTDGTLTVIADTGQTWVVNGAWSAAPAVVNGGEGKCKAKFNGPPAEEMF